MIEFLMNKWMWIAIAVCVILILIAGVMYINTVRKADLTSNPVDCLLPLVLIFVIVPFKYVVVAICVVWLYIRYHTIDVEKLNSKLKKKIKSSNKETENI